MTAKSKPNIDNMRTYHINPLFLKTAYDTDSSFQTYQQLAKKAGLSLRLTNQMLNQPGPFNRQSVIKISEALNINWKKVRVIESHSQNDYPHETKQNFMKTMYLIQSSRYADSPEAAQFYLQNADNLSNSVLYFNHGLFLKSFILSERARLEKDFSKRGKYRESAISQVFEKCKNGAPIYLISRLCRATIDYFYDTCDHPHFPPRHYIAKAKEIIETAISDQSNMDIEGQLLAKKSALLRCQSRKGRYTIRTKFREEMLRCSSRAVDKSPQNANVCLERAQALWSKANTRISKHQHTFHVTEAISWCNKAHDLNHPLAKLIEAKIYRFDYCPNLSLQAYHIFEQNDDSHVRPLVESYILGEAAWSELHRINTTNDYTKTEKEKTIWWSDYACKILYESIACGYINSRIILSLAKLEAERGNIEVGDDLIMRLSGENKPNIIKLIEFACQYVNVRDINGLRNMFVLGFDNASCWNTLGSYIRDYYNDEEGALYTYNGGLKLGPTDQVLLTNSARCLSILGRHGEAKTRIQKARSCATTSFMQWVEEVHSFIMQNEIKER